MSSARIVLCAAIAFIAIQAATACHVGCGYETEVTDRNHGYGYEKSDVSYGYDKSDGSYGYDKSDVSYGYGSGYGRTSVVKLPVVKKTTVVCQPWVHETRQSVVTVHEPAIKNTYKGTPQVSHSVQKGCKAYVQKDAPVVSYPTTTYDDSYSAPITSYPSSYSNSPVAYTGAAVYRDEYRSYPSHGHGYIKGGCGC